MTKKFSKYKEQLQVLTLITFLLLVFSCNTEKNNESTVLDSENVTQESKPTILFFGNSLTAGYGIEEDEAFPALIGDRLDSLGYEYRIINGGLSGETTAGGLSRLDWFLEEEPEIFVLELGGNDGLRGIALEETQKNLKAIINMVQQKYPDTKILLAGMQIPPNMGQEYTQQFREIYPQVAEESSVTLIPFLLEGVAGDPDLNLKDGIHPTEEGHKIVLENVWPYLKPLIER
ncbi:MAG: arylesterase [Mongoliibacter sp.]|uniref:arylesterase n=1 Tax=Mongoliibacter sp. TaxID=2022438 RepID=UPI0012F070E2|nr:arylesterase [Mongoliibacter sp.]TVP52115.1 MAG: arylesterase [Mongoliibacter sp.]